VLIDELQNPKFLQDKLGFPSNFTLNLNKLIVGGHSFGGVSAIGLANADKRVKACITLDPWLLAIKNELSRTVVNKPF
jgi:pimeloyl-ACP methyl ester carboxylesterase